MPYIHEECVAGNTVEVNNYYAWNYGKKGSKRQKREKPTPEAQLKINFRNAVKRLRRLMNTNFKDGDFSVTLDFRKEVRPENSFQMKEIIKKFLRKLRASYQKQGLELKYIYVMEIGKKGARHYHLVINAGDIKSITAAWDYGGVHIDPLYTDGQYGQLAEYFIKYSDRTIETEGEQIGKRWYASRNLEKPIIKKKVIKSGYFKKEAKIKKGYYLQPDSVHAGISDFDGYEYYGYTLIRLEQKQNNINRRKNNV